MKKLHISLLTALVLGTASIAPANAADYVTNHAEIVKAADWKTMETITINLLEYEYEGNLNLKQGQPYKFELKTLGEKKHYFTAPEFFKNIATRKAQVNDQAEIKAEYFNAIEVLPGGQLDLYFVAQNAGEYEVYCTIDDHRKEGMEGIISIK